MKLKLINIIRMLWPTKIRSRLVLGFALILLGLMTVFIIEMARNQNRFLKKQNLDHLSNMVYNYAVSANAYLITNDYEALQRLTLSHKGFPDLKYAMILSPEGVVLAHTEAGHIGKNVSDSISRRLNHASGEMVLVQDNELVDIATPIILNNKMAGWARAGITQQSLLQNRDEILQKGLIYILVAIVLGIAFAIVTGNQLSKGLYKLISAARKIQSGERSLRVQNFQNSELSELSVAFNDMLNEISHKEELLGMVIEHLPVGLWILDKNGQITSSNAAGNDLWGGSMHVGISEYGIYKGWNTTTKKMLEAGDWAAVRAIKNGLIVLNEEVEILTFDGITKFILNSAIPLKNNHQEIVGAIVINVDITQRKMDSLALARKNKEIQERIKELRCLYKLSELANDQNLSLEQVIENSIFIIPPAFQYPEYTGAKIHFGNKSFTSPGFAESLYSQEASIKINGEVVGLVTVSYSGPSEDPGSIFLEEEKELISSIASIISNAIETRMAQQSILNMAEEFKGIIENVNESIILLSPQFKILQFNKTAKDRLLINTGKEIHTGDDFTNFLYAGNEKEFYSMFNAALQGDYKEKEIQHINTSGESYWIRTRLFPIYHTTKELIGITILAENITARKKAEKSIVHFNRLYQFTSAINEMMLRAESKQEIFSEACHIAVEQGNFIMAWIGNFSIENRNVLPLAVAGKNEGYLENLQIMISGEESKKGSGGISSWNQEPYYINDIENNPLTAPWKQEAIKRGYKSLISLPLMVGSRLEAVFTLYMDESFFFNDTEIKLLQEVTNNIAYAVEKLELKDLQKKSESELKESEEKFRKLVEETLVGVYILQEGKFVYVNPQFEKISGYTKHDLLNEMSFEHFIHKDDLERTWKKYLSRIAGDRSTDHYFIKAVKKDGTELQIEIIVSAITYQGQPAIIGTIIDVTEQFEEEKRINMAVTDAQERERLQISMELHDNVKQIMAASLLNLDYLLLNLKDENTTSTISNNVKNYIRSAIEELRRISHQLAPSVDKNISFEEKIRTVINTMNVSRSVKVNYNFEKFERSIRDEIQLALYRIMQEQFTNILKYAKASNVSVSVYHHESNICMSIEDDGIGFDTHLKRKGIGLENIKRRAQVFNGTVVIDSDLGKGCMLHVSIPDE